MGNDELKAAAQKWLDLREDVDEADKMISEAEQERYRLKKELAAAHKTLSSHCEGDGNERFVVVLQGSKVIEITKSGVNLLSNVVV